MDEHKAIALAELLHGEAFHSGGGIWLVLLHRDNGSLVVFSGDAVCEYPDPDAFEAARASTSISLATTNPALRN